MYFNQRVGVAYFERNQRKLASVIEHGGGKRHQGREEDLHWASFKIKENPLFTGYGHEPLHLLMTTH